MSEIRIHAGSLERHADDLLVRPLLVGHVEHADRAHADPAARERRLADEHERVERVAVLAERALDVAVVGRVAHRREEPPVEHDPLELVVPLVLVPRPRRDLDEDDAVTHASGAVKPAPHSWQLRRATHTDDYGTTTTTALGGDARSARSAYALALIVAFMVVEVALALVAHSLALLSDAAHMLVDAAALGLSVWAARLARRPAAGRMTFGFRRAEILAAQANGVTLLLLGAAIVIEAAAPARLAAGRARRARPRNGRRRRRGQRRRALAGRAREPPQPERRGQLPPPPHRPLRVRGHRARGTRRLDDRLRARRPDRLARGGRLDARDRLAAPPPQRPRAARGGARGGLARRGRRRRSGHTRASPTCTTCTSGRSRPASPSLSAHVLVGRGEDCHGIRRELEAMLHDRFALEHTTLQVEHTSDRLLEIQPLRDDPRTANLAPSCAPTTAPAEALGPHHSREWWGLFSLVHERERRSEMIDDTRHYIGAEAVPAEALEWAAETQAQMVDLKFCDLLGSVAAHDAAAACVRRGGVRRGARLRRLVDPRLAGDLGERHAADAAGRDGDARPVHRGADAVGDLRGRRPGHPRAVREGSAADREERRGATCSRPGSPTRRTSGPSASSSSSTRSPTGSTPTASHYEVDSAEGHWNSGTPGPRLHGARRRRATSRRRRTTRCTTCAPRWC